MSVVNHRDHPCPTDNPADELYQGRIGGVAVGFSRLPTDGEEPPPTKLSLQRALGPLICAKESAWSARPVGTRIHTGYTMKTNGLQVLALLVGGVAGASSGEVHWWMQPFSPVHFGTGPGKSRFQQRLFFNPAADKASNGSVTNAFFVRWKSIYNLMHDIFFHSHKRAKCHT